MTTHETPAPSYELSPGWKIIEWLIQRPLIAIALVLLLVGGILALVQGPQAPTTPSGPSVDLNLEKCEVPGNRGFESEIACKQAARNAGVPLVG